MAINLSATEAVDLVCDDVFYCEREREGVQELYSYCRGTTVQDREYLLAKAVISLPVEETTSFQLESY